MAGAKAYLPPTNFAYPVTFRKPVQFISDGTTSVPLTITGLAGDPLKQLMAIFDGFSNPIQATNNAGGLSVFGDNINVYGPGDIFNPVWQALGSTTSGLNATSGGMQGGKGAGTMKLFFGTGAPVFGGNPDSVAANGDVYIRKDGGAGTVIYQVRGGAWVATGA